LVDAHVLLRKVAVRDQLEAGRAATDSDDFAEDTKVSAILLEVETGHIYLTVELHIGDGVNVFVDVEQLEDARGVGILAGVLEQDHKLVGLVLKDSKFDGVVRPYGLDELEQTEHVHARDDVLLVAFKMLEFMTFQLDVHTGTLVSVHRRDLHPALVKPHVDIIQDLFHRLEQPFDGCSLDCVERDKDFILI